MQNNSQLLINSAKNSLENSQVYLPNQNQNPMPMPMPMQMYPNPYPYPQQQQMQMHPQQMQNMNNSMNQSKKYQIDQNNINKYMQIYDRKQNLMKQNQEKLQQGNEEVPKEQHFFGGIYASVYDLQYNNGLRNEKTLKYQQKYGKQPPKQTQQIRPQQPDNNNQKMLEYQKALQEQIELRRREMEQKHRLKQMELELQRQKALKEAENQRRLEEERLRQQMELEELRKKMLEEEQRNQFNLNDIAGTPPDSSPREEEPEEGPDPLQLELERERQRLKELQEQVERDKRNFGQNFDIYEKMVKDLNNNVISAKHQIQANQNHLNDLLLQMKNEQLKNQEERALAQERINALRAYNANKELDDKVRLNALQKALDRTQKSCNHLPIYNPYAPVSVELGDINRITKFQDGERGVSYHYPYNFPDKTVFLPLDMANNQKDGDNPLQKIEYNHKEPHYTSIVTQSQKMDENQDLDYYDNVGPMNQNNIDLDALNAKNEVRLTNLHTMEIQQGMGDEPDSLQELNKIVREQ